MTAVTDELVALAEALTDAGIPATTNPAKLWPMVAAHPVAALIDRPRALRLAGLSGVVMEFDAVAWLVSRGPDSDAEPRLQDRLVLAMQVMESDQAAEPDRITAGDVTLPAYRITSGRHVSLT